jgi:hypothetical protein
MTDEKIRDYQRKARAGHDPVAELRGWVEAARKGALPHPDSAPLVERLARGALDRERLALAAYAGHKGALPLVYEETVEFAAFAGDLEAVHVVDGDDVSYRDLAGWLGGLARWGVSAEIAAQLGLGRALHAHGGAELEARMVGREPGGVGDPGYPYYARYEINRLEELLRHLRDGLDAAERLILEGEANADRGRIAVTIERAEKVVHGYGWGAWGRATLLALSSALEGQVVASRPDRFGNSGRSPLQACEHERVPASRVATGVKGAVVCFALRREDGGTSGG